MTLHLTPKQVEFWRVYLENGRKVGEAYKVSYNTKMSIHRCSAEGHKLLRSAKFARLIGELDAAAERVTKAAIETYAVSRERNIAELARMAYANMADYTRRVGPEHVVDLSNVTRDQMAAVQEIVIEDFIESRGQNARDVRRVRFKLHSKQAAIDQLNRMMGWIVDKSEVGKPNEFATMSEQQLRDRLVTLLTQSGLPERQAKKLFGCDPPPPQMHRPAWRAR